MKTRSGKHYKISYKDNKYRKVNKKLKIENNKLYTLILNVANSDVQNILAICY